MIRIHTVILCFLCLSAKLMATLDTVPTVQEIGLKSTEIESFYRGDITSGIPLIQAPKPVSSGAAIVNMELSIPEGRQNMTPQLQVSYNSEEGHTWLGTGWNIDMSSVTLDTRWGVPRFDPDNESELYLLDGAQLGPVSHRSTIYPRESNRVFYKRQTQDFLKIERKGTSSKDYWWLVTDKDGKKMYYGYSPDSGLDESAMLKDETGNIIEWKLVKEIDRFGNCIDYSYRMVSKHKGSYLYLHDIYYTGYKNEKGKYRITFLLDEEFGLEERADVNINYRSGARIVQANLLSRCNIYYNNELIRYYSFDYISGVFSKTLLKSISEWAADDILFYNYEFDYHDDLNDTGHLVSYKSPESWTVPKDDVVDGIVPVDIDELKAKPTVLGGSISGSDGKGLAITLGPPFNPASKINSAGPNFSSTSNSGNGAIALIDINSDGLPDKLFKEGNDLFFRANESVNNVSGGLFGEKKSILNVSDFSASSSDAFSVGFEVNLAGFYGGFTYDNSTTTISTYISDFNGDELVDIAHNGKVFFNTIDNGIVSFTPNSDLSESPILKGAEVDPNLISLSPEEIQELQTQNPLHDVVRRWEAPFDGRIRIEGTVNLIDQNTQEAENYEFSDGVIVSIQHDNQELWESRILANDFSSKTPQGVDDIRVNKGDHIYFRLESVDDGLYDEVLWNPIVTYNNEDHDLLDVNTRRVYAFNCAEDFLLSSSESLNIPKDGMVSIICEISKPLTSDNIDVVIPGYLQFSMSSESIVDTVIVLDSIDVLTNQKFNFDLRTDSEIDYHSVDWNVAMHFIQFEDGNDVKDGNGEEVLPLCPSVKYNLYRNRENIAEIYTPESSESFRAELDLDFSELEGEAYFVAKSKNKLVAKRRFTEANAGETLVLQGNMIESEDLIFEVFCKSYNDLPNSFLNEVVTLESNSDNSRLTPGFYTGLSDDEKQYGTLYRNWGQFVYNGNQTPSPDVLNESDLELEVMESDTVISDDNTMGTADAGSEKFIVMTSDPKRSAWQGSDALTYVTANTMSSTRFGRKNISQLSVPSAGENNIPAVNLISKYESYSLAGGYEIAGGGSSWATTESIIDITDMNGDRYPDIVSASNIQYSTIRGGLNENSVPHSFGPHTSGSFAFGGGLGGSKPASFAQNAGGQAGGGGNKRSGRIKSKISKAATKAKGAFNAAKAGVGFSGDFNIDADTLRHSWMDINGDGLEDKVWNNGRVAFNKGYSFDNIERLDFGQIRKGQSLDFSFGLGLSLFNGSIVAGRSYSVSTNHSDIAMIDLNDDALVDIVESVDPIVVRWNTGNGFTEPVNWYDQPTVDYGVSIGEADNYAATVCLELFFFRICVNPSSYSGHSNSSIATAFVDINGDGFPDFLEAKNQDDNLIVHSSNIGRTNLLKQIHNPLGGSIELDYKVEGNTYDLPFSKWVLARTTVNDGVAGDGANVAVKTFDYSDGRYDRHERQFLGFGRTVENHTSSNQLIRSLVKTYSVNDVYSQGLVLSESVIDSEGSVFKSTHNTYQNRDLFSGIEISGSLKRRDELIVFPALIQEKISYYEKSGDSLSTERSYEYDFNGNVTEQRHFFSNDPAQNYTESFSFSNDLDPTFRSFISQATISDNTGIIRKTIYQYDSLANMINLSRWIDQEEYASYDYSYDKFGNQIEVLNPENHNGERLSFNYFFDDSLNQYVVIEKDGYGHTEYTEYNFKFGETIKYTDLNSNTTEFTFDRHGRPNTIIKPYEVKNGKPYTVKFEYNHNAPVAYATAEHFDPEHDNNIIVYNFADGLGRDIQTQTQAYIVDSPDHSPYEGFIVSGTESYDELGRIISYHHPRSITTAQAGIYQEESDPVRPLIVSFDIMDRPVEILERDGGVHHYEYDIAQGKTGINCFLTRYIDPIGKLSNEYYDLKGNLMEELFIISTGNLSRIYNYNVVSDLVEIIDAQENVTSYSYDNLGRRTDIKYPGTGLTELKYDKAGNLTERITATIRDVISSDGSIRYSYDRERLIGIDYPKYFQNKVQIHYGTATDSFNRVGRIWLIEDGTGGREYFFDANGQVEKEIRTIMINRTRIPTWVTEYRYDTWERLQEMIYPDGEILDYEYNTAGKLSSIRGTIGDDIYNYIQNVDYDKFDDINNIHYGNGVKDKFYFEDEKGRLFNRKSTVDQVEFYDESYAYDLMDNILLVEGRQSSPDEDFSFNCLLEYDDLYRMFNSELFFGNSENAFEAKLSFEHNNLNLINFKSQEVLLNGELLELKTKLFDYQYSNPHNPYRPSELGGRQINYDNNGNITLVNSAQIFEFSQNTFDEENRLMAHSENGYISRFTYDAFGERTIKSHGSSQGVFINGSPAGFIEHRDNVTVYVSPYFTYDEGVFMKHVFLGDKRILTKQSTGSYNSLIAAGNLITAGGLDYKSRIQQYEQSILDYYAEQGVAPGPPTLLAYGVQPEVNTNSLPDASSQFNYDRPGVNWPNLIPEPDTSGAPGPPVFYESINETREEVQAGYGFSNQEWIYESQQWFYHYDLDHNTRLMTDITGEAIQFFAFLPTGELLYKSKTDSSVPAYIYNMRELDDESGLYYFGDEYFDPVFNLSLSVDAVAQNFGERTYKKRLDGDLFYDYANEQPDLDYDTEILNSEKPEPLIASASGNIDLNKLKYQNYDDLKDAFRDETPLFTLDKTDIKKERRNISFKPMDDNKTITYRIEFAELNEINKNLEFVNGTQLDFTNASSIRKLRFAQFKMKLKNKLKKLKSKIKSKVRIR